MCHMSNVFNNMLRFDKVDSEESCKGVSFIVVYDAERGLIYRNIMYTMNENSNVCVSCQDLQPSGNSNRYTGIYDHSPYRHRLMCLLSTIRQEYLGRDKTASVKL